LGCYNEHGPNSQKKTSGQQLAKEAVEKLNLDDKRESKKRKSEK